jgi:putative transposase
MDERLRFVARRLDGEKMAVLCREFGISRKTGYKIFNPYQDCGVEGLTDRSRRPYRHARQLPFQIEKAIIQLKQEHPSWGAPKIRERLRRKHSEVQCPAISTVHAILDRNGLVKRRRRRRYKAQGTALSRPYSPNDLWCADYFTVFERAFKDFGLPRAIRTDNGMPFASANSLFGLTRLSVWWLRLGIDLERIKPGHPQQNGRHERMHLTLKNEATKPASQNFLQQQARFDEFIATFNQERPHEALNMRYPAELYSPSPRPYNGLPELEYPFHERTITVTRCGRICMGPMKINLSQAFAGQKVGVKQVEEKIWLVSFMRYDLGFFDHETCRIESAENPFTANVLPMSPV